MASAVGRYRRYRGGSHPARQLVAFAVALFLTSSPSRWPRILSKTGRGAGIPAVAQDMRGSALMGANCCGSRIKSIRIRFRPLAKPPPVGAAWALLLLVLSNHRASLLSDARYHSLYLSYYLLSSCDCWPRNHDGHARGRHHYAGRPPVVFPDEVRGSFLGKQKKKKNNRKKEAGESRLRCSSAFVPWRFAARAARIVVHAFVRQQRSHSLVWGRVRLSWPRLAAAPQTNRQTISVLSPGFVILQFIVGLRAPEQCLGRSLCRLCVQSSAPLSSSFYFRVVGRLAKNLRVRLFQGVRGAARRCRSPCGLVGA